MLELPQQDKKGQQEDGKEADTLLRDLQKDYEGRSCVRFRHKKTRVFVIVLIFLIIVMLILAAVSLLTFTSVILPPSQLDLCPSGGDFVIVPLGTSGGITEDNLSSFLLSRRGSPYFLALDGGDIFHGLSIFTSNIVYQLQHQNKYSYIFSFPDWAQNIQQQTGWLIKNNIIGYFIGHPHLDHLLGFMAAAPEDYYMDEAGNAPSTPQPKSIIGLESTLSAIASDLFNGIVWADFPKLNRYTYQVVSDGSEEDLPSLLGNFTQGASILPQAFPNNITVKTHLTCHDSLNSSAFLFTFQEVEDYQVLFFSDTGVPSSVPPSFCNWTERIAEVWASVNLPKLRVIIIEVSFPNEVPDSGMYGHLRPKDLMAQLHVLASMKKASSLSGLNVIIQHIKPILTPVATNKVDSLATGIIKQQLDAANDLKVNFIFPTQGEQICI